MSAGRLRNPNRQSARGSSVPRTLRQRKRFSLRDGRYPDFSASLHFRFDLHFLKPPSVASGRASEAFFRPSDAPPAKTVLLWSGWRDWGPNFSASLHFRFDLHFLLLWSQAAERPWLSSVPRTLYQRKLPYFMSRFFRRLGPMEPCRQPSLSF